MKKDEVALMINSAFSLIELIIRIRNQNPGVFDNEDDKLKKLAELTDAFKTKPHDYLQTWEPKGE